MDGFEIIDPRFRRFVLPNAPLEKLADGFRWKDRCGSPTCAVC
jgi:gluconolactonase